MLVLPNKYFMELSRSEEDYLKTLFSINIENKLNKVGTNQIADSLGVSPASANGMLKKLKSKELVDYEKYGSIQLTKQGRVIAIYLIRKHRLWETFLYEKLGFSWDEVHEVAEQLEHIKSTKLIQRLDKFLDFPKTDPHGDGIPDKDGNYFEKTDLKLAKVEVGKKVFVKSVNDISEEFLKYLSKNKIELGTKIQVLNKIEFDGSLEVKIDSRELVLSKTTIDNIFVNQSM